MENQNNRIFYESIFKEYPDVVNVPFAKCWAESALKPHTVY